jgi:hypothetical protein
MAQRIALTRKELGNTVGAHWSVLRAQAQYSRLPTTQNAVSLAIREPASERRGTTLYCVLRAKRSASESRRTP